MEYIMRYQLLLTLGLLLHLSCSKQSESHDADSSSNANADLVPLTENEILVNVANLELVAISDEELPEGLELEARAALANYLLQDREGLGLNGKAIAGAGGVKTKSISPSSDIEFEELDAKIKTNTTLEIRKDEIENIQSVSMKLKEKKKAATKETPQKNIVSDISYRNKLIHISDLQIKLAALKVQTRAPDEVGMLRFNPNNEEVGNILARANKSEVILLVKTSDIDNPLLKNLPVKIPVPSKKPKPKGMTPEPEYILVGTPGAANLALAPKKYRNDFEEVEVTAETSSSKPKKSEPQTDKADDPYDDDDWELDDSEAPDGAVEEEITVKPEEGPRYRPRTKERPAPRVGRSNITQP